MIFIFTLFLKLNKKNELILNGVPKKRPHVFLGHPVDRPRSQLWLGGGCDHWLESSLSPGSIAQK